MLTKDRTEQKTDKFKPMKLPCKILTSNGTIKWGNSLSADWKASVLLKANKYLNK